jgi:hypothetical protein
MGLPSGMIQRNREAAAKRRREAKQSLISELGLAKDVDPDIASAIFSRVPDPVYSVRGGKAYRKTYTKQETADLFTKGYQAELAKIGQPELTEAIAAGADPRTIEALKTSLISAYTTPQVPRIGGPGQHRELRRKRREKAVKEQTQAAKNILRSETKIQPALKEIRRLRQDVAQRGASLLRRNRGSRALLSSPTGGSGFFGGYFKG